MRQSAEANILASAIADCSRTPTGGPHDLEYGLDTGAGIDGAADTGPPTAEQLFGYLISTEDPIHLFGGRRFGRVGRARLCVVFGEVPESIPGCGWNRERDGTAGISNG
jgi:hypothetical protein